MILLLRCRGLLFCLFFTVIATAGLSSDTTKPAVQVEWIRANAIPLKTVEAGNGFDEMMPMKGIVGDARVVALGEATRGTHEFFQLKHRIVEFLATQMGFAIFTIEANMPEAYKINDYVLHGNGDPKALRSEIPVNELCRRGSLKTYDPVVFMVFASVSCSRYLLLPHFVSFKAGWI